MEGCCPIYILENPVGSNHRLPVWNISRNNRIGTNFTAIPKHDIANHLGACTEKHAFTNPRSDKRVLIQIDPKRHLLENCRIIPNLSVRTYNDSVQMGDVYPPPVIAEAGSSQHVPIRSVFLHILQNTLKRGDLRCCEPRRKRKNQKDRCHI